MKFIEKLDELNACSDAVGWCRGFGSPQKAWDACERADWSLWLMGKLSGEPGSKKRKKLVLCACEIARLALQYVPNGEKKPLVAIETAERWAKGDTDIFLQNVRTAFYAAYAADAADAADAAFYAAAAGADKKEMQIKCADIVRKHYPKAPGI